MHAQKAAFKLGESPYSHRFALTEPIYAVKHFTKPQRNKYKGLGGLWQTKSQITKEKVNKTDNWACPACADLVVEQKQRRSYESSDKELIKATWKPTWDRRNKK